MRNNLRGKGDSSFSFTPTPQKKSNEKIKKGMFFLEDNR